MSVSDRCQWDFVQNLGVERQDARRLALGCCARGL